MVSRSQCVPALRKLTDNPTRKHIMTIANRPTSHSYYSQRLRLHYLDWGNSEAPHMLLVHGVQDHCHTWDWC